MESRVQKPENSLESVRGASQDAGTLNRNLQERIASMDAAMDGMALHDESGVFIYLNPAHAQMYGYDNPQELLGQTWETLYDESELRRFRETIMPVFKRVGRWRGEAVGKRKNGSLFPEEVSLSRIPSGGFVCVARDINQRKERENATTRLAAIIESAEDSIISVDCKGIINTWNPAAEKLHGYRAEEVLGKRLTDITVPKYQEDILHHLRKVEAGEPASFETERIKKDGSHICLAVKFSPVRDANGTVIGASTIARDITQRKQQEEITARLAAIVESSEDGIYSADLNGIITSWNSSAERLFGFSASEAIGQSILIIYPPRSHRRGRTLQKSHFDGEEDCAFRYPTPGEKRRHSPCRHHRLPHVRHAKTDYRRFTDRLRHLRAEADGTSVASQ